MRWLTAISIGAVAAAVDDEQRRIPNQLVLVALAAAAISGGSPIGLVAGAAVPTLRWWHGELGAGDVKLSAALGALVGARAIAIAEVTAFALAAGARSVDPAIGRPFAPLLLAGLIVAKLAD